MHGVTRMSMDTAGGILVQGSPNVFVNGMPASRLTDKVAGHGLAIHGGPVMASGTPTVIVNGLPLCRAVVDRATCGHQATGSPNVFAGDGAYMAIVSTEPGVFLVGGTPVYDNSDAGQAAARRDENAFDTKLSASESAGGAPAPATNEKPAVPTSCDKFPTVITLGDMTLQASKYFKLSHSGKSGMIQAQRGLTGGQIACNWAALCTAILDNVYDNFKFNFNSGFRTVESGMGMTDHGIGCAADISMPTTDETVAMFKWMIASKLPFSQIIYEKHNSAWVHVSFNGAGPKGDARTMWTFTGSAPYGHGGQNGTSLPSSLA